MKTRVRKTNIDKRLSDIIDANLLRPVLHDAKLSDGKPLETAMHTPRVKDLGGIETGEATYELPSGCDFYKALYLEIAEDVDEFALKIPDNCEVFINEVLFSGTTLVVISADGDEVLLDSSMQLDTGVYLRAVGGIIVIVRCGRF